MSEMRVAPQPKANSPSLFSYWRDPSQGSIVSSASRPWVTLRSNDTDNPQEGKFSEENFLSSTTFLVAPLVELLGLVVVVEEVVVTVVVSEVVVVVVVEVVVVEGLVVLGDFIMSIMKCGTVSVWLA